ncbi:MarC family protein [Flammeovirga sp. OC4]|uniref:MarC family protein n=1 Tax=Flammeovirga sp. OC4 TaxID=1382345 RepID=UPI0005C66758|nr:MarC family protein [Flammeovirga sp. OC4]
MEVYFQGILTIFSLINPVICSQIFGGIERGKSYKHKLTDLTETIFTVGLILAISAFFGAKLLNMLEISLDAFQVAGGLVLVSIGFGMLNKKENQKEENNEKSLMPLILFAASPGTITGVITLSISEADSHVPVVALISIAVVLVITWIIIALLSKKNKTKASKTSQITTRFMGLIILAMGVQFILTGIMSFTSSFH